MPKRNPIPILITGAGGEVGSVSKTIINMLLDKRRRVYFSMSLNPSYADATILMAAAARAQGDIEVFVNISEFEQSFMTFDRMTAAHEARLAWLGGLVAEWSPQQRAHWSSEQALKWSGLPVVNIQATMFVENPILSWFPLKQLLGASELHLPFGTQRIAPIAAYDVAEICTKILIDPSAHISMSYALTGRELKDMHGFCKGLWRRAGTTYFVRTAGPGCLDRDVHQYCPGISQSHIAEYLRTITRLVAGGRYDVVNGELERLLGRAPKVVRWALEQSPRIRKALETA
jgi:NAD(P)H dehydrogenase (quinone)